MAGVDPVLPEPSKDKKPFENVCPQCQHAKATQRPVSSHNSGRIIQPFRIKKMTNPASIKERRIQFE